MGGEDTSAWPAASSKNINSPLSVYPNNDNDRSATDHTGLTLLMLPWTLRNVSKTRTQSLTHHGAGSDGPSCRMVALFTAIAASADWVAFRKTCGSGKCDHLKSARAKQSGACGGIGYHHPRRRSRRGKLDESSGTCLKARRGRQILNLIEAKTKIEHAWQ